MSLTLFHDGGPYHIETSPNQKNHNLKKLSYIYLVT